MLFKAALEVRGRARVERSVSAFENVDEIGHEVSVTRLTYYLLYYIVL